MASTSKGLRVGRERIIIEGLSSEMTAPKGLLCGASRRRQVPSGYGPRAGSDLMTLARNGGHGWGL